MTTFGAVPGGRPRRILDRKRDIAPRLDGPELLDEDEKFTERESQIRASILLMEQGMLKYLDFRRISAWRWPF
jgi:hypothetical protein